MSLAANMSANLANPVVTGINRSEKDTDVPSEAVENVTVEEWPAAHLNRHTLYSDPGNPFEKEEDQINTPSSESSFWKSEGEASPRKNRFNLFRRTASSTLFGDDELYVSSRTGWCHRPAVNFEFSDETRISVARPVMLSSASVARRPLVRKEAEEPVPRTTSSASLFGEDQLYVPDTYNRSRWSIGRYNMI